VLKNLDFTRIYKGNDKRPLGLHSKRKSGSTQAKKRGAGRDQVDHCGRWVTKKGSQIVNKVYIDPEDVYADALCASVLAIGGPIHYKVKPALSHHVTANWLAVHVVPGIAKRKTQDLGIIRNLGLALLWLAHDEEASDDLAMPDVMKKRIKDAYSDLPRQDKPYQPVEKFALHVYRHGEKTVIEEVAPLRAQSQEGQQPQNLADALAGIPASGGSAATQQVLQTLVIQQRNLQQQLHDMQQVWSTTDQRNRDWLENKFRTLNDNIRKFGGTIQGGLLRQDRGRQAAVRRDIAEGPHAEPYTNRGRVWPTLAPNVRDLMVLWNEWEYGVAGRKAAKDWTSVERGGGGNRKVKQMYHGRRNIWRIQQHLINKGRSIHSANALIEQTYGINQSITAISMAIARDRATYGATGGLHPNFR
jgi:hypothetical protein